MKGTVESAMKEKIEYLGLNFERVPKSLIATDRLEFKVLKGYDEKQYNDAISKQSRLVKPIEKPKDRKQFWEDYKKMGFKGIAQKYFRFTLLNKFLMKLYIVLVNIGSFRIANKIARKIFY